MSRHFRRGGASPEEYGDFFAWAELEPKSDFTWATYKWMKEGQSDWKYITKYTFADGKKEGIWYDGDTFVGDGKLALQDYDNADDAAYAALGGKVRMPTDEECLELMNNCTFAWKTTSDGYACNGILLSSKVNSNSIFMPATGCRGYSEVAFNGSGSMDDLADGKAGLYWSSTVSYAPAWSDHAYALHFGIHHLAVGSLLRSIGAPIRPVCD